MAGLLYKELILNKKNLVYIAIGELFASFLVILPLIYQSGSEDTEYVMGFFSTFGFFMMFLIMGMMVSGIFQTDETKKWAYFISASPLTHTGQILSKYLFTLLLYITLLVWCYFLTAFLAVFNQTANFAAAFEMLWIMLFANAVEFPFIVRFGSKSGTYVKTAIGTVLILFAFEWILFGETSFLSDPEKFFALFERLSDASAMTDIFLILTAVIPYLSAGLYFLSYKLSCKLYPKGAEEYE